MTSLYWVPSQLIHRCQLSYFIRLARDTIFSMDFGYSRLPGFDLGRSGGVRGLNNLSFSRSLKPGSSPIFTTLAGQADYSPSTQNMAFCCFSVLFSKQHPHLLSMRMGGFCVLDLGFKDKKQALAGVRLPLLLRSGSFWAIWRWFFPGLCLCFEPRSSRLFALLVQAWHDSGPTKRVSTFGRRTTRASERPVVV